MAGPLTPPAPKPGPSPADTALARRLDAAGARLADTGNARDGFALFDAAARLVELSAALAAARAAAGPARGWW